MHLGARKSLQFVLFGLSKKQLRWDMRATFTCSKSTKRAVKVVNAVFVQQTMLMAANDEDLAFKQKQKDWALYTKKVHPIRFLFVSLHELNIHTLNKPDARLPWIEVSLFSCVAALCFSLTLARQDMPMKNLQRC